MGATPKSVFTVPITPRPTLDGRSLKLEAYPPIDDKESVPLSMRIGVVRKIAGTKYWLCPACGQKMGAIIGERVIVKVASRELRMSIRNQPEQDCIRCGVTSHLSDLHAIEVRLRKEMAS